MRCYLKQIFTKLILLSLFFLFKKQRILRDHKYNKLITKLKCVFCKITGDKLTFFLTKLS